MAPAALAVTWPRWSYHSRASAQEAGTFPKAISGIGLGYALLNFPGTHPRAADGAATVMRCEAILPISLRRTMALPETLITATYGPTPIPTTDSSDLVLDTPYGRVTIAFAAGQWALSTFAIVAVLTACCGQNQMCHLAA
jgi:hypothetical protein